MGGPIEACADTKMRRALPGPDRPSLSKKTQGQVQAYGIN
jgi:hypothetical protein